MNDLPSVAVLLPVYNEAASIDQCLASLAAQAYGGDWEVIAADGGSTDGTLERLGQAQTWLARLSIIDNPGRLQSHGLNLAAASTSAEILVRADAHTTYSPNFLASSVEALLLSGADAVGGPMVPKGETSFGHAIAAAYRSKVGIGPAPFHHTETRIEGDTVYLGTMSRATFLANGGMRTLPSRVAEDADFFYRLRQRGGRVVIDPAIESTYHPRSSPGALWRQFYRYGLGKADMLYLNGEFPSWRPLAPLVLILGLAAGVILGLLAMMWWPLVVLLAAWIVVLLIGGRGRPLQIGAITIMHLGYGLGLVRGLLRSPRAVRANVR